jgi:hypothetical protein
MADPNGVTVNLATVTALDGWGGIWKLQGTDTLLNIENVEGSQFNDNITGDANANRLEGGAGNDTIDGGAGFDTLVGGIGTDVFRFGTSAASSTITDFSEDVLDFSPLFAAQGVAAPAGEDPLAWLVDEGYLLVDSTGNSGGDAANDTVIQIDVDGFAGASGPYTAVTLLDVTLGTTGVDADNWLV